MMPLLTIKPVEPSRRSRDDSADSDCDLDCKLGNATSFYTMASQLEQEMKRFGFIAAIMLLAYPLSADDCLDAVRTTIRAASSMNEEWWSSCKTVARDPAGRDLCDTVHATFARVFVKRAR